MPDIWMTDVTYLGDFGSYPHDNNASIFDNWYIKRIHGGCFGIIRYVVVHFITKY